MNLKTLTLLTFGLLVWTSSFGQRTLIHGKIIDEKFENVIGGVITNKATGDKVYSGSSGQFQINATTSDTLVFEFIPFTTETRIVTNPTEKLKIILMDKEVNCLGAVWTDKQYKQANKRINKRYKDLYNQADKLNKFN